MEDSNSDLKRTENGNHDQNGRFKAGNTASVGKGRPKGKPSIPSIIKRIGAEVPEGEQESMLELVIRKQYEKALEGNYASAKLLFERLEGSPFRQIHLETNKEPCVMFEVDDDGSLTYYDHDLKKKITIDGEEAQRIRSKLGREEDIVTIG